jgi:hypothetical protein
MLWMTLLFVSVLAGLAYGWIVVRTSAERVTISLELAKIVPVIRKAKAGVFAVFHGERPYRERNSRQPR